MFWTPFTVMIAMGVKPLFQWSKSLFIIITIFSLLHLCAISGYYMPDGGLALGPRHLGPVLPLFAPLAAIGVSRSPTVGYVLAVISVLLIAAGTLISALTPSHISNPLWNYYAPRLLSGRFTHTILGQIGLGREIGGLATLWVIILLPFIIARTKLFTDVK